MPFLPPNAANFAGSPNAAFLAVYAQLDSRVNASRDAADAALRANLTHEVVTFPGVDHAFFNDTGALQPRGRGCGVPEAD